MTDADDWQQLRTEAAAKGTSRRAAPLRASVARCGVSQAGHRQVGDNDTEFQYILIVIHHAARLESSNTQLRDKCERQSARIQKLKAHEEELQVSP